MTNFMAERKMPLFPGDCLAGLWKLTTPGLLSGFRPKDRPGRI